MEIERESMNMLIVQCTYTQHKRWRTCNIKRNFAVFCDFSARIVHIHVLAVDAHMEHKCDGNVATRCFTCCPLFLSSGTCSRAGNMFFFRFNMAAYR
jgi:hypothetical protein